ncbi:hypothetical protein CDAR_580451 [Caerostris darwini]|uniref:Uncharacterized protein n=1 Tax=Caerostris darwini TaxID=1538125 RepID=A0AAV4RA19_9ARAC|nr:hypothetical protein CDAR_580451 [Caerostris darwini]
MRQTQVGKRANRSKTCPAKKAVEDRPPGYFPNVFCSAFTHSSTEHVFLHKESIRAESSAVNVKIGMRQTQVGKRANRSKTCPAKKAVEDRPPGYFPNVFCSAFTHSSTEHVFLHKESIRAESSAVSENFKSPVYSSLRTCRV